MYKRQAQSLANLKSILAEAGLSRANVVKTVIFLADINDFAAVNAVYAKAFAEPFPARSIRLSRALTLGGIVVWLAYTAYFVWRKRRTKRADVYKRQQAHFYVSDVPDSFVQTADLFLGEYKGGPVDQIAIDKY